MTRAIAIYSPRHNALTLIAADGESISLPADEALGLARSMLEAFGTPAAARQLVEAEAPILSREEWREARAPLLKRIEDRAREALKAGDLLSVERCGGRTVSVRMTGWDGCWITSAVHSDLAPSSIVKVNGERRSFMTPDERATLSVPPPPPVRRSPFAEYRHGTRTVLAGAGAGGSLVMPIDEALPLACALIDAAAASTSPSPPPAPAEDDRDFPF